MVTSVHTGKKGHLFIEEWMSDAGLNDEQLGSRIGVSRTTMWRWRTEQHRLNPGKISAIATALEIEPEQLWRMPPGRKSLDAALQDAPDELRDMATDIVMRLVNKRTG